MSLYEVNIILRQDLSSSLVEEVTKKYANIIAEDSGKVLKTEQLGLRNLAYIVKKNKKGHYVYLEVTASDTAIKEIERKSQIDEDVLRLLVVKVDEFCKISASAMLEERPRYERKSEAA